MDIKKDVILNVYTLYFGGVLKEIQNIDVRDNIKERKKELIKNLDPSFDPTLGTTKLFRNNNV